MADSSGSLLPLTLGFVGDQLVHRDNAFALIDDLIQAHRRTNRNAKVRFVIPVDLFTDTLDELADYCLNSKYLLDLVGHQAAFESKSVKRYLEHADFITKLPDDVATPVAVVSRISQWVYARLILIADPAEDDYSYLALTAATGKNIPVRTLLHGMSAVSLETDEEEQPEQMPKNVEPDEDEEFEDEDEEEGDYEEEEGDEVEPDDEDLEAEEDDEEEGDDTEEEEDGDDDDSEEEPEDEEAEDEEELEDGEESEDEPDEDEDVEEEEEEEVPTPRARKAAAAAPAAAPKRHTRLSLDRLAARNRDEFYELVASYGIERGKGIKVINMINSILEAQAAGEKPRAVRAAKPAPKPAAPVKKAAPVKAAAKPAPAPAKRPVAKTAAPAAKRPVSTQSANTNPSAAGLKSALEILSTAFQNAADQL